MDAETALELVERGEIELYISDGWLPAPLLVAVGGGGRKYLRTVLDSGAESQLRALPDCP